MHCARPVKPRTSRTRVNSGSRLSPPVTPATAPLVVEPASVSAGMLPLLPLLLDRQVAQMCEEEPPAQAGGFLFRTAMLRSRFPESPPASEERSAQNQVQFR